MEYFVRVNHMGRLLFATEPVVMDVTDARFLAVLIQEKFERLRGYEVHLMRKATSVIEEEFGGEL